ncbi:MAG: ABC transporter ATP-binding protein [Planctomycetes bacterium]|nr:ABC transporter ATP-binding protein [Planctomycetota bacterium]
MVEDALIELEGVGKWWGREQVLRSVDLAVPRGSVTALLGRNGCGKSTLVRIVTGLVARDGGRARVLGRDPAHLGPAERERLAVVSDTSTAWAGTRVRDELALQRRLRGSRWDEARAAELIARFELPVDRRLAALSKGMQARLRLVVGLAADPELLVLDEPALGLDLFARHDLLDAVIETIAREGRAVLVVSHLLDDVERIADRVAFLRHGEVTVAGAVDDLRARFRRARVVLGPGGAPALERAASGLLGVRRVVAEPGDPPGERVVVLDDHSDDLLAALEAEAGVERLEVRRMTLREVYFEVLGGREEVAA